jgi:hypothetical protein
MLSWGAIAYGAALSAILAVLLVLLVARERRPVALGSVAAGAIAGPVVWNAILRATNGSQFFTDAPIPVFPISWQDTGSGVFALAALTLILGFGPLHAAPGRRVALLAGLGALGALLVDIYLY